ncbi:hypothetical protein D9M69_710850 [compost metagenome]
MDHDLLAVRQDVDDRRLFQVNQDAPVLAANKQLVNAKNTRKHGPVGRLLLGAVVAQGPAHH